MALQAELVGKCYRKVQGKICGGNVIEHWLSRKRLDNIISPGQNKIADLFIGRGQRLPKTIFGPGEFAGYICTKCGKHYNIPPVDPKLLDQVARKLAKILARPNKR